MRAIPYVRVSKDDQELDAQKDACTRFCITNKLQLHPKFFEDDGLSGATDLDKRVGLWDAINELRRGDVLLVARRDRLAREDFIRHQIVRLVEKKGAKVVSAAGKGNGDEDDPTTYIRRSIVDMFATYERLLIKARTRATLAAKIKRGFRVGAIRYGYDEVATVVETKDGPETVRTLTLNSGEQAIIEQMRQWRRDGLGYLRIAQLLSSQGVPTKDGKHRWFPRTVKRILNRWTEVELSVA